MRVYHQERTERTGVIMIDGHRELTTYGYDGKQRLYIAIIKPFDNEKGFKAFRHPSPIGLCRDIEKKLDKIPALK